MIDRLERVVRGPATPVGQTAGLTLAGALFAGLVVLLDGGTIGLSVVAGSTVLLLAACWVGSPRTGYLASAGLLASTLFTDATPVLGLDPLLVLGVGAPLWITIVALVPTLDPDAGPRPTPPTRRYLVRFAGLAGLAAAIVLVPVLFTPVQIALSSEMGPTLAIFLVAGAGLLLFGPPLVALQAGRVETDAEELVERKVRFGVRGRRVGDGPPER